MALPNGYTQLGYIESSGTQYINAGVAMDGDTDFEIDFELVEHSPVMGVIGVRDTGTSDGYMLYSDGAQFLFMLDTVYTRLSDSSKNLISRHTASKSGQTLVFDGVSNDLPNAVFTGINPLGVFCFMEATRATSLSSMRLYGLRLTRGNEVLRDFVPVRAASGELGLYDKAHKTFYGNAGTGAFTAGPEAGTVSVQSSSVKITESEAVITLCIEEIDPSSGESAGSYVSAVSGMVNGITASWALDDGLWTAAVPVANDGKYNISLTITASDESETNMVFVLYYGLLNLITDRSQADLDGLMSLLAAPSANWTAEQAETFAAAASKGAYNYTDLNRVTQAMQYVDGLLSELGYVSVFEQVNKGSTINPYIWDENDTPTAVSMTAYLSNLTKLRAVLALPEDTPQVPDDMVELTLGEANEIEQILVNIGRVYDNVRAAWYYSGEIYAGEV